MNQRFYKRAVLSMSAISVIGALFLAYLLFIDGTYVRRVIDIKTPVYVTEKQEYRPGEEVYAWVEFCKYRDITAEVNWTLVNTYLHFYKEVQRTSHLTGCHRSRAFVEKIGMGTAPDEDAYFSGSIGYRSNPIRMVRIQVETTKFRILP